jgi:hypothetical protein
MRDKIIDKLNLTVMWKKNPPKPEPIFYLVGMVEALITWQSGKQEKIELCEKVKVKRFPAMRNLMGVTMERKMIEKQLKEIWIKELIDKMEAGIKKIIKEKKLYGKKFKEIKI